MIYNYEDLSFGILTIDRFFHKEGFFEVKARPYAALSFRVSGTAEFEIGAKHFIAKPGDVLFLPANTPYKVEYSVGESIVAHFDRCNYSEIENVCLENNSNIKLCFERLLEGWNGDRSVNLAKSIIYDLLDKMANDQKESSADNVVASCVRYMEEHYRDRNLDVESLYGIYFISPSSLQRAFARSLGVSPKQYLIRLRMNHALELMTKNELSVKEIAYLCGFADEKYFSRAFKKRYGCPPSRLKDNMIV